MKRLLLVTGKGFGVWMILLHFSCFGQKGIICGVVYENDQAITTFSLPQGQIMVYLPDDIRAGDRISGTVTALPYGKDDIERKKNLAELAKHPLYLPDSNPAKDQKLPVPLNGPASFVFHTPESPDVQSFRMELYSPDNKPLLAADITELPAYFMELPSYIPATITKKVITNTEPIVVLIAGGTSNAPRVRLVNYFSVPSVGRAPEQYELVPICHSPHKAVFTFPPELNGLYKVCVSFEAEQYVFSELINIVDIRASIGKGNLLKGETTTLHIDVLGLEACPYRPVELELRNNTPAVIRLEQGNDQRFPIDQSDDPLAHALNQPYRTTQNVIGQIPGGFEIMTSLRIPPQAYANPVASYLDQAETPQAFNQAIDALKQDLSQYMNQVQPSNELAAYLQQVNNRLPHAENASSLNQAKSLASNLLNPVSVMPEGTAMMTGLSGFKQLQPALKKQEDIVQPVHPLLDLAGEFDSRTGILQIRKTVQKALLEYLGAQQENDGNYTFTLSDGHKPVTYTHVQLVSLDNNMKGPGICEYPEQPLPMPVSGPTHQDQTGKDAVSKDTPVQVAGSDTPKTAGDKAQTGSQPGAEKSEAASVDSTKKTDDYKPIEWPGEPIEFADSTGRKYRFYKDAQCQELYSIEGNRCKPDVITGKLDPTTGKREEDKPTGNYAKFTFQSCRRCVKGTGFCTEMLQITTLKLVYSDKDCQNLIKTEQYEGFRCQ